MARSLKGRLLLGAFAHANETDKFCKLVDLLVVHLRLPVREAAARLGLRGQHIGSLQRALDGPARDHLIDGGRTVRITRL